MLLNLPNLSSSAYVCLSSSSGSDHSNRTRFFLRIRREYHEETGRSRLFYDSDSISSLFSWCHLMTLTWGNIHLGQTSRRRSCVSLEKVRIVRSADKGAQWISMISWLPPLWCAFWRCRSTTRDEWSTAWSHATGRQTKIFARSSTRFEFWFVRLRMGPTGVRNVREKSHRDPRCQLFSSK